LPISLKVRIKWRLHADQIGPQSGLSPHPAGSLNASKSLTELLEGLLHARWQNLAVKKRHRAAGVARVWT
jgi:hypothetical protein